jgi:hypothetical protein
MIANNAANQPMTLGNMRALGVQRLIASCLTIGDTGYKGVQLC